MNSKHPFVSVIIPVYNDEHGIQDTLKSLQQQDYPMDRWEVIVVDNNSTDQTRNFAQLLLKHITNSQITTETKQSSYAARNKGIMLSRGDIIAFIDSDITVLQDWISRGVDDILQRNADYVGCHIEITTSDTPSIWELYNQATGFPVEYYIKNLGFAPTAALFVKKSALDKVGRFDDRLISGGDYEFGTRIKGAGLTQYLSKDNKAFHPARKTASSLLRKTKRVDKGYIDLRRLHSERFGAINAIHLIRYSISIPLHIPTKLQKMSIPTMLRIITFQVLNHFYSLICRTCYYIAH